MSMTNVFYIAASALTAQSMRLNAVASNLANADSAHSSTGGGYKAKQVGFSGNPGCWLLSLGARRAHDPGGRGQTSGSAGV